MKEHSRVRQRRRILMQANRRTFIQATLGAGMGAMLPEFATAAPPLDKPLFALHQVANTPVRIASIELLRGILRPEIPVYLSSMRRDTTPEQEVAWLSQRLEETGAKAVKLKIGGRMSKNADAAPQRTERLVALARKTFGDGIAIHVDA